MRYSSDEILSVSL